MIWYPSISYRLPSLVVDPSYGDIGCLSPGMQMPVFMMTSSNGNIFRATGHLCGEFTSHKGQWRGPWCLRNHRAHCDVTVMFHGDLNLLHNLIVEDRPLCFRVFENKFSIIRVIFSYHYNTNYAASSDMLSTQKCAMVRWDDGKKVENTIYTRFSNGSYNARVQLSTNIMGIHWRVFTMLFPE